MGRDGLGNSVTAETAVTEIILRKENATADKYTKNVSGQQRLLFLKGDNNRTFLLGRSVTSTSAET